MTFFCWNPSSFFLLHWECNSESSLCDTRSTSCLCSRRPGLYWAPSNTQGVPLWFPMSGIFFPGYSWLSWIFSFLWAQVMRYHFLREACTITLPKMSTALPPVFSLSTLLILLEHFSVCIIISFLYTLACFLLPFLLDFTLPEGKGQACLALTASQVPGAENPSQKYTVHQSWCNCLWII